MQRHKIFIILLLVLPVLILSSCKKEGDEVAVKIDDEKISINEFNKFYYMQNKLLLNIDKKEIDKLAKNPEAVNHPTLNKTRFMDFLISRKLLYKKAMGDEKIKKDDLETIIELSMIQAAANYYLMETLKDEIEVTDAEADKFYRDNKAAFQGRPIDDNIITQIKQRIFLQKMEQKSNQFILDLLAESKVNREGFKKYLNKKKDPEKKKESTEKSDKEEESKE